MILVPWVAPATARKTVNTFRDMGAKGVKIKTSGRLGNSEMARVETQMQGSIPLQTLQAHVEYAVTTAVTKVGTIGIKVWIYLGTYGEEITPARPDGRFRRHARR